MASYAPELTAIENERPSKVRYWVVVFAVTLAIITYIDRVALSQAAPRISKELGLSKQQMGWVFFGFISAYALFEIPSGVMGDKLGPRSVLMRIVVWWSFFIALTGRAWNFISLVVIQTLFGRVKPDVSRTLPRPSPYGFHAMNVCAHKESSGSARAGAVPSLPPSCS